MLRLSKKADYGLIALSYMAAAGQRPIVSAREMAEQHDIPVELLAKVLQRLARRGVLTSVQGINGGYRLARAPQTISVAEVVEAIDGPLTLTACSDTSDTLRPVRQVQHPRPAASHPRADRRRRWPPARSPSSRPTGSRPRWPRRAGVG